MTKKNPKETGRPTVMTKEVVEKLEYAFINGLTDEEASFHAGIDKGTLYNYCKANPSFSTRKEILKRSLIVRSKFNLSAVINEGSILDSKWLLERKAKDEFSLRNEITGENGDPVRIVYIDKEEKESYEDHINEVVNGLENNENNEKS